ncbi:MAG: aldose epimerase [Opitutaceae bacterium]|jgi:galactose mutarotase-like enzyme
MEKISYLGTKLMRWQVGSSTFLARPELGARLMNWNIALGDGSVRDVIYWPELTTLDGFHGVRGGNPILFPFNGRTFDHGDIFFWRAADGTRRPMPMHGLARQGEFKLTHTGERGFTALFVPGEEARECYPFDYEFTVTYRFEPLGLFCELTLKNLGTIPLPWCAGHHFYFTLPWTDGLARSDYSIRIPATKTWRQDQKNGQLMPGPRFAAEESLANEALVDCFHTGLRSNEAVFGEKTGPSRITIRNGVDRVPSPDAVMVTWTLDGTSPFYCVEPWMGPANAAESKIGLHHVPPGGVQTFLVEVRVQ